MLIQAGFTRQCRYLLPPDVCCVDPAARDAKADEEQRAQRPDAGHREEAAAVTQAELSIYNMASEYVHWYSAT